jgi:hypothetical protein
MFLRVERKAGQEVGNAPAIAVGIGPGAAQYAAVSASANGGRLQVPSPARAVRLAQDRQS